MNNTRIWLSLALVLVLPGAGCSIRKLAVNKLGDALAGGGTTFASDDDPELVKAAVPFSLKLMESLLAENPRHEGLLLAAASGFTEYSYAFVQEEADEIEDTNRAAAKEMRTRARKLCLRARDYGLRGLELRHPGFRQALRKDPKAAAGSAAARDVPLLYWTAAAWASAVSNAKDDPDLVAELPIVEALIDRALALNEAYGDGSIHSFLITYELSRPLGADQAVARSRRHFERAVELSKGQLAGPFVSLAEAVSVQTQNYKEFKTLLERALAVDVNARPEWRLENTVMQRRAKWLLGRADELFLKTDTEPESKSP